LRKRIKRKSDRTAEVEWEFRDSSSRYLINNEKQQTTKLTFVFISNKNIKKKKMRTVLLNFCSTYRQNEMETFNEPFMGGGTVMQVPSNMGAVVLNKYICTDVCEIIRTSYVIN